ncbi:hypothetical protein NZZ89_002488 [Staphylococcus pseudintermedius]|nr:hypothetical protein [Staphylococcus pseudintermedius]EGQ3068757.1 hypothetical protein [Staphylococcus pseudintermedius]EII2716942.1 hypothetical protein [Staphylococcus pseudintermedius]EJM2441461.1 hypothetical protein [Staphylococcus pseudintermedius]EJQ7844711.1 hypothetical protein [Staphylococcus pseudintermedius]
MQEFKIAEIIDEDIKNNQIFKEEVLKYDKVIEAIKITKNSQISKASISRIAKISYSTTLIKLRFLEKYKFISYKNKIFKILGEDVENAYPFTIMSLVKVWKISLKRHSDVVEQDIIDILDIPTLEELNIAEGYFQLFSNGKDYESYILEKLDSDY